MFSIIAALAILTALIALIAGVVDARRAGARLGSDPVARNYRAYTV